MGRMSRTEAEAFLTGPDHGGVAILAVSRPGRGPLQVPLSFRYSAGVFAFETKPSRRHARAFEAAGRAAVIVHHEDYSAGKHERYVIAEGPIGFVEPRPADDDFGTAILKPESFVGVFYVFD